MTSTEISLEIKRCETAISRLQEEVNKFRNDEDRLDMLIEGIRKMQSDFAQRRESTIGKLEGYGDSRLVSCGKAYRDGMLGFLRGNEFHNTYQALDDDIAKIRRKQFELEDGIEEKQDMIGVCEQKISALRAQLAEALSMEAATV